MTGPTPWPVAALLAWCSVCPGCREPPAAVGIAALPQGPEAVALWRGARAQVERLRDTARPSAPYKMELALDVTHPLTGAPLQARGAVAVSQGALRMILLGPGGTTALDVWICGDRFRLVLPAADVERRGSLSDEPLALRGLPVRFLAWWFLRPFDGTLLAYAGAHGDERFLLRVGDGAIVDVRVAGAALSLERRSRFDLESVDSDGEPCGTVRYQQHATGLALTARCLALDLNADVPAAAFADPDEPNRACLKEPPP